MSEIIDNSAVVAELCRLLGDAVLIPINRGEKGPKNKRMAGYNSRKMSAPGYLKRLARGNIGVLQGNRPPAIPTIAPQEIGI